MKHSHVNLTVLQSSVPTNVKFEIAYILLRTFLRTFA